MTDFTKYIENVKEQLVCNATEDYKNNYITYEYSNDQIDNNLNYFKRCMESNLSPYMSLLYFDEYLNGDYEP